MNNSLEIYIVCHGSNALRVFREINIRNKHTTKYNVIFVGKNDYGAYSHRDGYVVASELQNNIEQHPSLLTFTAWYALSWNNILTSDYVGIFEYDCIITRDLYDLRSDLQPDHIIGFNPVYTDDKRYLYYTPELTKILPDGWEKEAKKRVSWNASTNVIMHKSFMNEFVDWYYPLAVGLINTPKHQHFHERAYNIYAANCGYRNRFYSGYIKHKMLRSHGVKLIDKKI